MKEKELSLSESEIEIMNVVWEKSGKASSAEITAAVIDKGWKRTTVATFLSRLCEKGALSAEKQGMGNIYTALVEKKNIRKDKTAHLAKSLFGGSFRELAASLFEEGSLSEDDIAYLKEKFLKDK